MGERTSAATIDGMARQQAMTTVLVGVDGSPPSIDAMALATELAPLLRATMRPVPEKGQVA
jgi:hypothetical protein